MINQLIKRLGNVFSVESVRRLLNPPVLVAVMLTAAILTYYTRTQQREKFFSRSSVVYFVAIFSLVAIGYMLLIKLQRLRGTFDTDNDLTLKSYDLKDYFLPLTSLMGTGKKLIGSVFNKKKKKKARRKAKRARQREEALLREQEELELSPARNRRRRFVSSEVEPYIEDEESEY